MASTDNAEAMRRARRVDSERKRRLVLAAADAQLEAGRHPTIAGIARQAGVGRKFIYDHPDLRAGIELKAAQSTSRQASDIVASARVTGASLRAELENARAQNHRLSRQIKALETRLSKAEGARLVADELLPEDVVAQLADQQLTARVAELDQQLFEARERLRHTAEELEAARAINRELMQQANRLRPAPGGPPTVKEVATSHDRGSGSAANHPDRQCVEGPAATCDTPVSHVECRQPPQETPGSDLVASFQDPSHC